MDARPGARRSELVFLALVAVACVAGGLARASLTGAGTLWGDEFHSLLVRSKGFLHVLRTYDELGSGIGFPVLQDLAMRAVGENLWGARLPAAVAGLASLLLLYPMARPWVGAPAAVLAVAGLAANPLHVFYSHFARSYALVVLLALVLAFFLERTLREGGRRIGWIGAVLSSGLLLYSHLASGAFVVSAFLGVAVAHWRRDRTWAAPALACLSGLLIGLLLHAPAWDSLVAFVGQKTGKGARIPFSWLDVVGLSFGVARTLATLVISGVVVATLAHLRSGRPTAVVLAAVCLLPVAVLTAVDPLSNAVAFSRYLIACLPFWLMALAWGWVSLAERIFGQRGVALAMVGGLALAILSGSAPLRASLSRDDAPFSNTYLALQAHPAFDAVFDHPLSVYSDSGLFEGVERVVEFPPVRLAGALLYRSHRLRHGRPTFVAFHDRPPAGVGGKPLLALADVVPACPSADTLLVVHRELVGEVRAYLSAVADRLPFDHPTATPLAKLPPVEATFGADVLSGLRERLGAPVRETPWHLAWRIRCDPSA